MIGRILLAGACLLGLAGCNSVVSMEPWFTAADAQGVPKFRDGLWMAAEAHCRVNVARSVERWPDCASAMFVRGDERLTMEWESRSGRRGAFVGWGPDPALIVTGEPLIGQYDLAASAMASAPDESEVVMEEEGAEPPWRYHYYAMKPRRFDEQDRLVEFETWPISCGPLPEPKPAWRSDDELAEAESNVTDQPFPGLTVIGNNCTAESVEALRRAAVLSEPLEAHRTARWVRDGWR